jgi:protein-disulfide isomerase/uncharacterized membrane protein
MLLAPVVVLLAAGLGASAYLLYLYVKVRTLGAANVDSFCAVSDTLNCVTVASSSYSTFLGVPIALYGVEFFAVGLALVVLSATRAWSVRAWDSLLFLMAAASLPACGLLAWVSAARIKSLCLMCTAIYGVNALLFVILLLAGRKQLRALCAEGLRQLGGAGRGALVALGLVVAVLAAQLWWAPRLLASLAAERPDGGGEVAVWESEPTAGLTIGPPDAPLKIEEFTDYQCPHCGSAHTVMMEVMRRNPRKVRLVHRDFPLDMACNPKLTRPFHPNACIAAYYARCAARQGKYWPYEKLLFENRDQLDEDTLRALGNRVGLDVLLLARCAADSRTHGEVQDEIREGLRRGIEGTPTLFADGEKIVGPRPVEFWEQKIREAEQRSGKR